MNERVLHLLNIVEDIFAQQGDPLTREVLVNEISRELGRPLTLAQLENVLRKAPDRFFQDAAGLWHRRPQQIAEIDEPEEDIATPPPLVLQPGFYVVFDLETFGDLDQGDIEIIQIAARRYEAGQPAEPWQTFVRASRDIPAIISHLTHITSEQIQTSGIAPAEALRQFFEYAGNLPLIAHNGSKFDGPVLQLVAQREGIPLPEPFVVLDTLPLARLLLTPAVVENHQLGTLATHYGCALEGAHFADVDVEMLCGVVDGLIQDIQVQPAGPLAYDLLRRSGEPWVGLLPGPNTPFDQAALDDLLSHFGDALTSLLPPRPPADPNEPGPTEAATLDLLNQYYSLGRERRAAQETLALVGAKAFSEGCFAVVEAGTGTGKGLGYLAPSALLSRSQSSPVVISTATRVLQSQLLDKDAAFLRQILPDLHVAVLKGKGNYLSMRALIEEVADALDENTLSRARAWTLGMLASYAVQSRDGDLQPLNGSCYGLEEYTDANGEVWNLLDRVRATAEPPGAPAPRGLQPGRQDFYARAAENARRADIVIVNHHWLFTHAVPDPRTHRLPELLSPFLVCDEAHLLEDAATSVLTRSAGLRTLNRLLRAIQGRKRTGLIATCRSKLGMPANDLALVALHQSVQAVQDHADALTRSLRAYVQREVVIAREDQERYGVSIPLRREALSAPGGPALRQAASQLRDQMDLLLANLDQLEGQVSAAANPSRVPRILRAILAIRSGLLNLRLDYGWYWSFSDENTYLRVVTFEAGPLSDAAWTLEGKPISLGALLHDNLWNRLSAGIFTSATIHTNGDGFGFFLDRTGLARIDEHRLITESLPHVFDYQKNVLLLLPNHLPTPRDQALKREYPEAVAAEIRRFIPFVDGKTLALFTARSRMNLVHETVVKPLEEQGYPILTQDESDAIDRFRDDEKTSLLGVKSLWQGVDVPGPSLSYVLMSKLPFPSLGDPLEAARMTAVERSGRSGFYDYLLPKMIFEFKQGFGRLMRSKDDRGVVILFDKRLRSATYREEVLRSLPRPTIDYQSDVDMYQRLAEWMELPFDPALLPSIPISDLAALLAANLLPPGFIPEAEFETVALPKLMAVLRGVWGEQIKALHPFQLQSIRAVLAGKDVLTLTPTGSGKSLTFQLPAMIRQGITLVISPLVALIRDQVVKLRDRGVTLVNALVSGMTAAEMEEALFDARQGKTKLLYLAPERLRDPRLRAALPNLPVVQLVVDESHCIAVWGHEFRPDFLEIPRLLSNLGGDHSISIPVHALTATAPPQVRDEIIQVLEFGSQGKDTEIVRGEYARKNLVYRVYRTSNRSHREQMAVAIVKQIVSNQEQGGAGIVYVATRAQAERMAELLRTKNIAAYAYHGGMLTPERHQVQGLFMDGEIQVVVATNAFGMGVDKSDIRWVLHFDHPASLEAYAQESGRAGRDGREAYAILLYSPETQRTLRFLAQRSLATNDMLQEFAETLQELSQQGVRLGDGSFVTSFDEINETTGLEPTMVRALLHHFEQAGLIERGEDVTLEATILLNYEPDEILSRYLSDPDRAVIASLFSQIAARYGNRLHYRAIDFSRSLGGDPRLADRILNTVASADALLYRPFDRGLTIRVTGDISDQRLLQQVASRYHTQYQAFSERLRRMIEYAGLSGGNACRGSFIIEHLSGEPAEERCGICDLCSPNYPIPWDATVTITAEPVQVDPAMAVLEAVRDHNGWFGASTLQKMLLGEAQGIAGGQRYMISPSARNSDHWEALKGKCDRDGLQRVFDYLSEHGFIATQSKARRDGGMYEAVVLTNLGRDVLAGQRELETTGAATN